MGVAVNVAFLLTLAYLPQNLQGSRECGIPRSTTCPFIGCWYKESLHECELCHNCTERGLMDGHPEECRGLPFPRYCPYDANGEAIATAIPKVNLPDNLQGNFSQNKNKWAVFFFREDAEEDPGVTYARVGKVCSHEWHKNSSEWVTFQKARLLCSSSEVEYNYLEHIINVTVPSSSKRASFYYGVFTKSRINSKESAICVFTTKSVLQAMRGQFSDPLSERLHTGFTAPVMDRYMPNEHNVVPGSCGGATLNDWEKTFIRTHPLMFDVVKNETLLHKGSRHFTRLVYDTQIALSGESYIVLFIGTDDGRLLKLVQLQNGGGNVLEEILLTPVADKIIDLEILLTDEGKIVRALSANSDEPLVVPVQRCVNMSVCACPQDPYCVWNSDDGVCEELSLSTSGDNFNQSVEEKQTCSRNGIHPALLTTSYRISPTTVKPSTTQKQDETDDKPKGDKSRSSDKDGDDVLMYVMWTIVVLIIVAILLALILSYTRWKPRLQQVYSANARHGLEVIATWTTITVKGKVGLSEWSLKNLNVQPTAVKGFMGKTKKVKFAGLTPLKSYTLLKDSVPVEEPVTTGGPTIIVVDGSVTNTSISMRIQQWDEDFSGKIKLISKEQSREKPILGSCDMLIDGLLPNLEYTIEVEITDDTQVKVASIPSGKVKTKEEEFNVERKDETHYLRWDQLPNQISGLIISTCCSPSELIEVDATQRNTALKPLCQVKDLIIKVEGKLQSSQYQISSLCFDARLPGACAELSCLSTMKDLEANIEFRKSLALLVVRTELVYFKYCQTLGYNEEQSSVFFKLPQTPENKLLIPLHDKNEDEALSVLVKALLINYEELFNSKSSSVGRDLQECQHIFHVMQKLTTFKPSCEACNAVFRRVNHKWECQGLKSHLPQDC